MKKTSVFIVDDHQLVIQGLLIMLKDEPGITIAGYATDAEGCRDYFKTKSADVILMDINLAGEGGIELCGYIQKKYPGVAVLALSSFNEGAFVSRMMANGAGGYLLKNASRQEILKAINEVLCGNKFFSFEAGKNYEAALKQQQHLPKLTHREKDIIRLIITGLSNTEISKKLFISIDTVNTHRKNIYQKLQVKNTAMLIRYAMDNPIID
jgi:DNA-binding NarL/FixJ family response regulator